MLKLTVLFGYLNLYLINNNKYFILVSMSSRSAFTLIGDTFQARIGIWKCWFLRRGENRSTRGKTSRSREENQQQTQPTYDQRPGIEPGTRW